MAAVNNVAAWQVKLGGRDLTETFRPRLLSLELTEKRNEKSDDLRISVNDHDGQMQIPAVGVDITVSMGWLRGSDVTPGLVDKGRFKVDEVSYEGPPDQITIIGRSADLTGKYRKRRDKIWIEKSVADIVGDVAARNGYEAAVHPDLAGIIIPVIENGQTSDMLFIRNLALRYDAIGTVKNGKLLFSPLGASQAASGRALAGVTLTRRQCSRWTWESAERTGKYDGVEAQYHSKELGERQLVSVGGTENTKRLRKIYGNEHDAKSAADAEYGRINRGKASMDLNLALGMAEIGPDMPITVDGFKNVIDSQQWLVNEAVHKIDASGGYATNLRMELGG